MGFSPGGEGGGRGRDMGVMWGVCGEGCGCGRDMGGMWVGYRGMERCAWVDTSEGCGMDVGRGRYGRDSGRTWNGCRERGGCGRDRGGMWGGSREGGGCGRDKGGCGMEVRREMGVVETGDGCGMDVGEEGGNIYLNEIVPTTSFILLNNS